MAKDGQELTPFKFEPIELGNYYADFRVASERPMVGGKPVKVLLGKGLKASSDVVEKIMRGVEVATDLFTKISGRPVEEAYPSEPDGPIVVKIHNRDTGVLWDSNLNAHRRVLEQSGETVRGGVLHEFIESYREEIGYAGDAVPFLAEFLFCGDDRTYFRDVSMGIDERGMAKEGDGHAKQWMKMVEEVLGESYNPMDWKGNYLEMEKLKSKMDEGEKVAMVAGHLTWKAGKENQGGV